MASHARRISTDSGSNVQKSKFIDQHSLQIQFSQPASAVPFLFFLRGYPAIKAQAVGERLNRQRGWEEAGAGPLVKSKALPPRQVIVTIECDESAELLGNSGDLFSDRVLWVVKPFTVSHR